MRFFNPVSIRMAALAALVLTSGLAQAHTGHGTSGLSEGVAHPLSADHLLAMVAVGIWSVCALPGNKAWWGPATFMLSLMVSAVLGSSGVSLPFLEEMIALSVVLFGGLLVLSRYKMPVALGLGWVGLAASLHGLAHGSETPASGFATYAIGFLATTATLHFGGVAIGAGIRKLLAEKAGWALASLGALCSGAGVYLFSQI
jgi:urease accessory protein